jgi:ribosome-binding factor A
MSIRTERVSSEIKQSLAKLFQQELTELYTGLLTVTQVRISPDLLSCKVYISILGSQTPKEAILEEIRQNTKRVRGALSHDLKLRNTPELLFYLDNTLDEVDRIETLLKKIHPNEND